MYVNMISDKKEIIRHLLQNGFEHIIRDNGVNEYRKKEISFYFIKNDIIIEFNPEQYFHVYQNLNYDTLFGIFQFCKLNAEKRNELISTFTPNDFINKIRKFYISTHKRKLSYD